MSFVYLSQFFEEPQLIKIGFSKVPEKRLKRLSNFYGSVLHSYTLESDNADSLERQLHKYFKEQRVKVNTQSYWYPNGRSGFTEFFQIQTFQEVFEAASYIDPTIRLKLHEYCFHYFAKRRRAYLKHIPFKGFVNI